MKRRKYGIPYEPRYIDTLAMARALLPDLKSHRLDIVAANLGLPEFNHHRASDDAAAAGLVLMKLFDQLKKNGVSDISQINDYISRIRSGVLKTRVKPRHIILLAATQAGIKNLYKLITKSHLETFNRYPIIPKSEIISHRRGCWARHASRAKFSVPLWKVAGWSSRWPNLHFEIQPICNSFVLPRPAESRQHRRSSGIQQEDRHAWPGDR